MATRPSKHTGLRHLALFVQEFEATLRFYTELLGMKIEWQPDSDNVYLTSGNDNLALDRARKNIENLGFQKLDHVGFILNTMDDVDAWYAYFLENNVKMKNAPKTHRDGARSFYCYDPDGNSVQMIYHPPLSE